MSDEDSPSFTSQVEALKQGESLLKVRRIPTEGTSGKDITYNVNRVRNGCSQITNRISKKSPNLYRVESMTVFSPDRSGIFCVGIVTRTDGIEDSPEYDIDI